MRSSAWRVSGISSPCILFLRQDPEGVIRKANINQAHLRGHSDQVNGVAVSGDGRMAVSAGRHNTEGVGCNERTRTAYTARSLPLCKCRGFEQIRATGGARFPRRKRVWDLEKAGATCISSWITIKVKSVRWQL